MHYVLVPGAWMGEWVWSEVASRLRHMGHGVDAMTLSGLHGVDDAAGIRLATHVQDALDHLRANGLSEVVLVGHSYAGVVVGQVAAQAPAVVARTVYVEAFLPVDGRSLLEVSGLDVEHERRLIAENAGLWPPPTREELRQQPGLSSVQVERLASRLIGHPGQTVIDPAVLPRQLASLPSAFIAGRDWLAGSSEAALLDALKEAPNWTFVSIEGGHWPMLTMPDSLAAHLLEVSAERPT
jgi:pimeloyl-ACP methyl ester carboxylesterase